LDELVHGEFLGAGVLIESKVSEDASQGCSGQRLRKSGQEIGAQGLAAMGKGMFDKTKQPMVVTCRPG
jgi:hypothetical protein